MPNENENTHSGDMRAIIEKASKLADPQLITIEHEGVKAPILLVPNGVSGFGVTSVRSHLDAYRTHPERRVARLVAHDIDSFIAMVNRNKGEESVIFADVKHDRDDDFTPRMVAVLDFHDEGVPGVATPRFCEDRISYEFPLSQEYLAWTGQVAQEMDQAAFAAWIEDHLFDIGEPGAAGATAQAFSEKLGMPLAGPSRLMDVSRGLSIKSTEVATASVKLSSGEVEFMFKESHEDARTGGPLSVPQAFHILIPIFTNGVVYSIPVRLRYRKRGSSIVFFFELHRAEMFLDDAVSDVLVRVRRDETGVSPAVQVNDGNGGTVTVSPDETELSPSAAPMPALPAGVSAVGIPGGCGLPVYLAAAPA